MWCISVNEKPEGQNLVCFRPYVLSAGSAIVVSSLVAA
jgi:hypothetical protein